MDIQNIEGRRRIHDEIERLVMECMDLSSEFDTFKETERGLALLDLYERFYRAFSKLVRYTRNLPQLRTEQQSIKEANDWLVIRSPIHDDKRLAARLSKGTEIFDKYVKLLADTGVIFPSSKG